MPNINSFSNSTSFQNLLFLFFITLFSSASLAKSASLIEIDNFGSDPYNKMANLGDYFVATGSASAAGRENSPTIDIVQFKDSEFTYIETINFRKKFSTANKVTVEEAVTLNEHFIILVAVDSKLSFIVANIIDGKFNQVSELDLGFGRNSASLLIKNNNLYLVDNDNQNLTVKHFSLDESFSLKQKSSRIFGELPKTYPTLGKWFSATITDSYLLIAINDKDNKATFYQLPVDDTGILEEQVKLNFDGAKAEYRSILILEDTLYLSYQSSGFQVAKLAKNKLSLLEDITEPNWIDSFVLFSENLLIAQSSFYIYLYDIADTNHITLLNRYDPKRFVGEMLVKDKQLFVTLKSAGIEAFNISDDNTFVSVTRKSYSGEVTDFTIKDDTLVSSAMFYALNVWQFSDNNKTTLTNRFTTEGLNTSLTGVEFQENNLLVINDSKIIRYNFDNILNNIDDGVVVGSTNLSSYTGELIALPNGYLSRLTTKLDFFDTNMTHRSTIEIENPKHQGNFVQTPSAYNNYLFVHVNTTPSQVIVYDISDLSAVTEVTHISLSSGTTGNLIVKDDQLFVSEYEGPDAYISIFDLNDIDDISKISSIKLDTYDSIISMHIYQNYLAVTANKAWLYDISDISSPILIDQNDQLSSNGISTSKDKNIFNVVKDSGGYIQRSMINMAPNHEDLIIETDEDVAIETLLTATDEENDDIYFEITTEPENGSLELLENNTLKYTPNLNFNGSDQANLTVKDTHGGSSNFTVSYTVIAVNDAPTISSKALTTNEDTRLVAQIEAQDIDGDKLTFEIVTKPEFGSATLSENGQLTYQPNSDFFGDDKIEISVIDVAKASVASELVITVIPVNDLPVITSTSFTIKEDQVLNDQLSAIDTEDQSLSFSLVEGSAQNGNVKVEENGSFVFTPMDNFNGKAKFSVIVTDSEQGNTEQIITIDVEAVEDTPVTENSSETIAFASSYTGSLTATDADGDALTFTVVEDVKNGTLSLSSDGAYTYKANASFSGTDSFTYQVTDTNNNSTEGTVNFTVQAQPQQVQPSSQESKSSSGGGSVNYFIICLLAFVAICRRRQLK